VAVIRGLVIWARNTDDSPAGAEGAADEPQGDEPRGHLGSVSNVPSSSNLLGSAATAAATAAAAAAATAAAAVTTAAAVASAISSSEPEVFVYFIFLRLLWNFCLKSFTCRVGCLVPRLPRWDPMISRRGNLLSSSSRRALSCLTRSQRRASRAFCAFRVGGFFPTQTCYSVGCSKKMVFSPMALLLSPSFSTRMNVWTRLEKYSVLP
jgi:hypothetical protein